MKLYIMRHGLADHPDWHGPDSERPLTQEGMKVMKAQGKRLAAMGVKADLILHSPLVRCRQTAEIVAKELGADRVRPEQRLSPGFNFGGLVALLTEHASVDQLMLVCHAPDCIGVATTLMGGGNIKFGKGSLACLKVDLSGARPAGVLQWLATDDLLTVE